MKKRIYIGLVLVAMVVTLTFGTALPAALATPKPQPAVAALPAPPPHPEIRGAINSLQRARTHLEEAKHDFHGHRADALKSVDEAIRQLQLCMQYDN